MTRYVILTWFLVALVLVTPAFAGNCHQLYFKQHHVQAVAIVQPLYFAGQALHDEATIRKAIRAELPAIIQQLQAQPQQSNTQQINNASTFATKCLRCHKGDNALTSDPSTFKAFARMAGLGEGVPDQMRGVIGSLSAQEKGELTEYLLRMPESPPPPPQPEGRLE